MTPQNYLLCMGTRPEIIKMAPVYRALQAQGQKVTVLHTGQHEEVAQALYRFFDMKPDISIALQRQSPSLTHLSSALLNAIDAALLQLKPDVLLVQGDTTTALVGALQGYYHDIPVGHVEAGLRTGEREPFPEEKNRELIGRLSRWHFAPTRQCKYNLLSEGVDLARIFEVGNTVIDAACWTRDRLSRSEPASQDRMPPPIRSFLARHVGKKLMLITAHRRENWGQPIRSVATAVAQIIANHEDTVALWPVHPNPSVQADVNSVLSRMPAQVRERICLSEPLGYQTMISLLLQCEFALTDSGGIQEEASAFGKPVLVARQSTERQELVQAGGAVLVGTSVEAITAHADALLTQPQIYRSMQLSQSPFGDGQSAQRIAAILVESVAFESAQQAATVWPPFPVPALRTPTAQALYA
ncbi:MAG: UDP-N-acetylglucosamine 2-epimerase (non-hydrolyzing) [Curvibacter lanceolatus]|jgi:UDP-N-acetylglucosamine 2-epimerase|uniref:non-hydrolyzing UDP-N-acetylglucosamine 2-epimerase n=1 Tax=Curvibacter lanceolatus TaxID=86182 RepID=UPI00039D5AC8|nr:UDP-N-acetylglucosamine 2-epimerase (non-hydrolyzing) [Curvibacter lanceolatus]MBV5291766.1 UDP-N-acetylglucosamine 2-epimerase (non-hydrolyzing) [Curvibacter lanceolatus]